MKKIIGSAFLATISLLFFAVRSLPEAWKVDTDAVEINWEVPEESGEEKGTIGDLEAEIRFDPNDLAGSQITASVAARSLETNNKLKTKHLMAGNYFNADDFPRITFTSQSFAPAEDGYMATGVLNFTEHEVPVEVPFSYEGDENEGKFHAEMWLHTENDLGIKVSLKSAKKEEIKKNLVVRLTLPVSK